MKLQGSLKDLVKVGENKREQLPPPSVAILSNPQPLVQPGRKRVIPKDVVYVPTRLQLPEALKLDLDRLFLDHKKELKDGKNQFMVEAIREAIKTFKAKAGKGT